jgi:hypothetical protein
MAQFGPGTAPFWRTGGFWPTASNLLTFTLASHIFSPVYQSIKRRLVRSRRHRRRDHRQPHRRVPATALESARHGNFATGQSVYVVPPGVPL